MGAEPRKSLYVFFFFRFVGGIFEDGSDKWKEPPPKDRPRICSGDRNFNHLVEATTPHVL
jgi:hypothetical protein